MITPEEEKIIIEKAKDQLSDLFEAKEKAFLSVVDKRMHDFFKGTERKFIDKAKEEILLTLPEVWSNLFMEIKSQGDLYEKFYNDNPDFKNHKEAVKSVFGDITGKHPNLDFTEQAEKALPEIKARIANTKGLNMDVDPKPDTDFKPLSATIDSNNGAI